MRVINLRAKNIKNLTAVEITPSEDAVILRGKNGAGKSAVIDSIFMALTGTKIDRPIREGENKAVIEVDLGEYTVVKTYTPKGSYLKVSSKNGSSFASPQAMLDKLLGTLSFDPLHFVGLRPPAQRIILMDLAGLNFDEIDRKRQELFEQRTFVNRQARDMEGILKGMIPGSVDLPHEEISISDKVELLKKIQHNNDGWIDWSNRVAQKGGAVDGLEDDIHATDNEIESLEVQIKELKEINKARGISISERKHELWILKKQEPDHPTAEDIIKTENNITKAEQTNTKIRAAQAYKTQKSTLAEFETRSEKLTKAIAQCDTEKQGQIVAANMPIEGLAVDDEQMLYHNLPVSQLSTGEQIRVSTSIAMALNPDLRVLCVREGSLLDEEGMQAIQQQAKDNDFQLWIERVSEGGVGIIIEDGSIKQ